MLYEIVVPILGFRSDRHRFDPGSESYVTLGRWLLAELQFAPL